MKLPLTYGQCLRKIMQDNHLTVGALSKKLGYLNTTQLTRILNDEVSPALITKFHHQFMIIFDWLISPGDIKALSASLQFSCLGEEAWLTRRAMYRMVFEPDELRSKPLPLHIHPEPEQRRYQTLGDLIRTMNHSISFDLIILGSAFDHILSAFTKLFTGDITRLPARARHYFILEETPAQAISQVSAVLPYLNTDLYTGLYCTPASEDACQFLRTHQLMIGRFTDENGVIHTELFLPPRAGSISVHRIEGSDSLYRFYEQEIAAFADDMRPIKTAYPQPETVDALLTLCQRDLFLEQNRACCFIRMDLCFHALPSHIVMSALDDGASIGLRADDPLMQMLLSIHQQRYANFCTKAQPTTLILSLPAMRDFMRTGHLSDHLFAMRDFTPEERHAILTSLLDAAQQNPGLHIHLLQDESRSPNFCFSGYADMGLQISANHTTYNPQENHSEVFVSLPALSEAMQTYADQTLVPEYCYDETESIRLLSSLL